MLTNDWLRQLTEWSEGQAARWAIDNGWHVLHVADLGRGASMAEGRAGKVIMPDLQLFDLAGIRHSRLVEVKAKPNGAYKFQKLGIWCTGTDRHKWLAYKKINAGGVPVDLAFIHLKPRKEDVDFKPHLLWAPISALPVPMEIPPSWRFPSGGVVWDVTDGNGPFQFLGWIKVPDHILNAAAAAKVKIYPWDKPPKMRRPKDLPGQLSLFDAVKKT